MDSFADNTQALDRFLASVERRALKMAQFATRSTEDALDNVQWAMLTLAGKYAGRPEEEWKAPFYTILQNRIRDWYRRKAVRARWRVWLGGWRRHEEEEEDPLSNVADSDAPSPTEELIRKDEMAAVEQALKALPLRQQQAFLLRAWKEMSPKEKEKTRSRFERFRDLPPEEQERLRRISRWYRNLPPERKKELREKWQSLPPERKKELREKWQRGTPEDRQSIRRELRQKN